ncbi:NFX1-type zinc finger-containing protein 1 [Astyanax mexicanus]|uniref:NFX1-type zinc finger-containing protein 1 n=1 Tax=Astyanax mexicanus TaxID=7994 RepID=A0A8T2M5R5_ASTMX|nr:NFX1-type zinc finger-containing protein 1 [Astyanax mexicanus]
MAPRGRGAREGGRGGRGRGGNSRDGTPEVRRIGYKTLEDLLLKDSSEVAITLSSSASLRLLLDERTMRQDLVQLLCQVLCKAFQSKHDRRIVLHLAQVVKDSAFLKTVLPYYVTGMMTDSLPARRLQYPLHLGNILSLLSDVVSMFPSSSVRTVSMLVALLKPVVNQLRASGVDISATVEEDLEKIQAMVDHLQEKARDGTLRSDNYTILLGNEEAPPGEEDFRTITIYPTPEEFQGNQKPFLRPNITSQRYPSAHVYLDTHFRLLREDFVRPLREGIQQLLQSQQDEALTRVPMRKRRFDDIRVYFDTQLVVPLCTPNGIAYKVKFDARPLEFVRWENSKRLIYGSLVCLSKDNFETFLYATVSDRDPKLLRKGEVQLSFSKDSRAELARMKASQSFLMVETTAYFEAYRYVLVGLQEQEEEDLPFQAYIVECNPDVLPPAYLPQSRETYDLSCVAAEGHKDSMKHVNPLDEDAWPTEEQLGLDESQLRAFKLALTKELAIVQGPPGTGKTYVGLKIAKALLENSKVWSDNSPMLVVCYTNHALDQFLEGIHSFMKNGIVRVGGRSNSEILKPFSLRELKRTRNFRRDLPSHLKKAFNEIYLDMREAETEIQKQSAQLECSLRGVINERFLQQYIHYHHWDSLIFIPMMNEYAHVGEKLSVMKEWLGLGDSVFQQAEQNGANGNADVNEDGVAAEEEALLEVDEEANLIQADRILEDAEPWGRDPHERRRQERDLAELADLMLAMNLDQAENQPPHQQGHGPELDPAAEEIWELRPSATVYELAKNFNLEVSMFERLVNREFPYVRLNYQHRMRPDIARLLTPHIYSELENHPSVLEYEDVKGIFTNLFFIDHKSLEVEIKDNKSHQNLFEAHFVVALCRYLLCQDYQPSQITILTTYTGQLFCLKKLMPSKEFSGVNVHVVDKYQGEENDIVILSLVRSNLEGRVGFLQIPNRVCVALSRAKKGLYCIGNMEMFSKVKLWSGILHTLREKGQVGPALTLSCQNHPEKRTLVSSSYDFKKKVPEGGCNKPCEFRLDCGHVCIRMCHPYDVDHKKYKCNKDCPKVLCELGHRCTLKCYQECRKCEVLLEKIIPQCQHIQKMPCHQEPELFVCQEPCQKMLSCGHQCQASCGEPCTTFCQVIVPMTLKCGHTQDEECGTSENVTGQLNCRNKCKTVLKCGHPCPGTCHECFQGRLHRSCRHKCQHILPCSHQCRVPCSRGCPPCTLPCENRCVHSVCKKKCGQPCAPCAEPCQWQCPHQRCSKLCHEPCDRPPCSEKCDKQLPCGHPCIGLCGDSCPNKCRICNRDEVTEIFFGSEDEPDARFIQLDCGHIIESTAMDHYMSMDEDKAASLDQLAIRLKECPKCRQPIRKNTRYGTHVNRSLAEIEKVKERINGSQSDIKQKQEELKMLLKSKFRLMDYLPEDYERIRERLQKSNLSLQYLLHQENLISVLESLGELKKTQEDYMSPDRGHFFLRRVNECLKFLRDYSQRFSEQQVEDLEREMKRLSFLADLNVRCKKADFQVLGVRVNRKVRQAREILEDTQPFTEKNELEVKGILKELDAELPRSGLGISDDERKMIVNAMNMNRGHWFKCPNGHIYAIGDCGGAMESRKCPDCDARIGGASHTLTAGNTVASEMDGAQHAAWSEQANLLNFDPRDL